MKKAIVTVMAAGLVAAVASADVGVSLDFASAYVFRGVTFNDGLVFQPGIEASGLGLPEELGSVAVGAWGNMDLDDYSETLSTSQFSEIDMYASYSLPTIVSNLDLFVGYCDYTYPGAAGPSDKEASIGAGYEIAGIGLGATYYVGIGGGIAGTSYIELAAGYGFDLTEELSASVDASLGYADIDGGESGFNDYSLGGSVSYALTDVWSAGASLTYIGQGDDMVLPDGMYAYDADMVGMLSLAAGF